MPNPIYGQGSPSRVTTPDQYLPGQVLQQILVKTGINLGSTAAQAIAISVLTAAPSTAYGVSVNGRSVSFTSSAIATIADVRSALISALNSAPEISGNFVVTTSGTNDVILVAIQKGVAFAFGSATANLSALQTIAPTLSPDVPAGRIMVSSGGFSDGLARVSLPSSVTQKALGATMRSFARPRDLGQADSPATNGDTVSLLSSGQISMEFESMVNTNVPGSLFYRSVPAPGISTGALTYAATAPAGFVPLSGSLDSPIVQVSDGKFVAIVSLSV